MTVRISTSMLSGFGSCRRRWVWENQYQSKRPPSALVFGQIVHSMLDIYYSGIVDGLSIKAAREKMMSTLIYRYPTLLLESKTTSSEIEYSLLEGMLFNYTLFDSAVPLPGKVISLEKKITSTIPGEDRAVLSGRIDLVLETPSGGIWIVDHKTTASAPRIGAYDVDEQLTGYVWQFWRETGIMPEGVIFNILIKSLPNAPVVLKSGQLSRDKGQGTIFPLYLHEIRSRGLDESSYREYLTYLNSQGWSRFFCRDRSYRSPQEIYAYEDRLGLKATEIVQALSDDRYAYPSPSIYTCPMCPFLGACKSKDSGGDFQRLLDQDFTPYSNPIPIDL